MYFAQEKNIQKLVSFKQTQEKCTYLRTIWMHPDKQLNKVLQ